MTSPKVFLSYHRASAAIAQKLSRALRGEGFEPWLDTAEIRHTERWPQAIDRALRESDRIVLLLTEAASDSDEVFNEWFYFYATRKPLHVVRLDTCELHYQLMPFQRLDWGPVPLVGWESRVAALVAELRAPFTWPSPGIRARRAGLTQNPDDHTGSLVRVS